MRLAPAFVVESTSSRAETRRMRRRKERRYHSLSCFLIHICDIWTISHTSFWVSPLYLSALYCYCHVSLILLCFWPVLYDTILCAISMIIILTYIFVQLEEDSVHFDVCLTTPTLLDRFKPLQKILKSKMPNVRRGTVYSHAYM